MTLIEKQTKLLLTDYMRHELHLLDLDGNILKSFNPNNVLKYPGGICVLDDPNEEKIFVGDFEKHKIFVFNSNFDLKFQFGDQNLEYPDYMQIDNEFDKSRLYVSDYSNNEITIWNTENGSYIAKIDIDSPEQIYFTQNSLFVSSPVFELQMDNNKVIIIEKGGNCIFEIDKASLEIKRKIIGNNWFSPTILNIEPNGNLQITACGYINNITLSNIEYVLTIDQNGKIIEKFEIDGIEENDAMDDILFVKNKIMATYRSKLVFFDF